MPALSKNRFGKSNIASATGLEQALKDINTAIIGDTLHFESGFLKSLLLMMTDQPATPALGVHDLDGTRINPSNILESLTSTDVFYHVWAAAKQTIDERCVFRSMNSDVC
jgi:hypothetical protein